MNTLHSTTFALLVGGSLGIGSALAASDYWDNVPTDVNPGNPSSLVNTTYSGQFDGPISFSMLDNEGGVSYEAIFGPVKAPQFVSKETEYIGTSEEETGSYWSNLPDNY